MRRSSSSSRPSTATCWATWWRCTSTTPPQRAAKLVDAVADADPDAVARMAHTLKGSSSTLGAAQVAHLASELEQAAKAGDLAPAPALLDSLHLALEETRKAFRDRTAEPNNDGVFPL